MARFRGRPVRRRIVRRRYRRRVPIVRRRPYYRKSRYGSGNLRLKLTKAVTYKIDLKSPRAYSCSFLASDFPEMANIAPNFEYFRISKARIRILPHQSASLRTSSSVSNYVMVPWHRHLPTEPLAWNDYLSIDHNKIYRMTERGKMIFNTNVMQSSGIGKTEVIVWTPKLTCDSDGLSLRHYCGIVAFQGDPEATDSDHALVTVVHDVYCRLYRQTTMVFREKFKGNVAVAPAVNGRPRITYDGRGLPNVPVG